MKFYLKLLLLVLLILVIFVIYKYFFADQQKKTIEQNYGNDFLKEEFNYNYDLKKKFIILQKTFDVLNLPKEDILVDNPKGIYFGFTYPESKKILKSKSKKDIKLTKTGIKTAAEIFDWWVERWATQRYNNLVKNNKL
jgi:hypothetical protein